jgi:MoaA/NifB/PqqE/SkfB family radical SAM enzyme
MRGDLRDVVRGFLAAPGGRSFFERHTTLDPTELRWRVIADVTVGCNLNCAMCFKTERSQVAWADPEVWQAMVEKVLPHAAEIAFGCRHEALLHPGFSSWLSVLDRARGKTSVGASFALVTSGTLLSRELMIQFAEGGLDYLLLSIPTTNPAAYAALRAPAKWEDLQTTLANALAGSLEERPRVAAQTLLMRATLPHLQDTLLDLATLDVGGMHVPQMVTAPESFRDQVLTYAGPLAPDLDRAMDALEWVGDEHGVEVERPRPAPDPIPGEIFPLLGDGDIWDEHLLGQNRSVVCAAPWVKLRVDHVGNAFPCPFWTAEEHAWGNLTRDSFDAVVNGAAAVQTRSELLAGRAPNAVCAGCPFGPGTEPRTGT